MGAVESGMEVASNNVTSNLTLNESVDSYILRHLGPAHHDLVTSIVLTVVYVIVLVAGLVGNVCVCLVISRNQYMRTATNIYLFSLAVSDLMLLLAGLPHELYAIWVVYPWPWGEVLCYARNALLEMTSYASVLTIVAFTLERYLAICHPLKAKALATPSRAVRVVAGLWGVAALLSLPFAVHTRLYPLLQHPDTQQPLEQTMICSIPPRFMYPTMYVMFHVSTAVFFVLPMCVITCLYIRIGLELRRVSLSRAMSDESQHAVGAKGHVPAQPRRVVIRMLVAVTVAFFVCWAPFHAQRMATIIVTDWTPQSRHDVGIFFYISGTLYFVSSTLNPILYNVISRRYRLAFKQTLCALHNHGNGRGQNSAYPSPRLMSRVSQGTTKFRFSERSDFAPSPAPSPDPFLRRRPPPVACTRIQNGHHVTSRESSRDSDMSVDSQGSVTLKLLPMEEPESRDNTSRDATTRGNHVSCSGSRTPVTAVTCTDHSRVETVCSDGRPLTLVGDDVTSL